MKSDNKEKKNAIISFLMDKLSENDNKVEDNKISEFPVKEVESTKDLSARELFYYEDLTPKDNIDNEKNYANALNYALQNETIKNIGITGPRGAGKSSIIKTYAKNHREYTYLNISLGNFAYINDENLENRIEKSILQQIFYSVSDENLPKLKLAKTELEVNGYTEDSLISRFFGEVIHFFEVQPFDVVIFQDIDTFGTMEIFGKLRELNKMINNSSQIYRKVVFIYEVSDDIFTDKGKINRIEANKNRAKFFDFIIPVIPVVNSNNTYEILKEKLMNLDLKKPISDSFIKDITMYIDDMRQLTNIYNEFVLYESNLRSLDLDLTKLLAMVVYKNLYPEDYIKLQSGNGIIGEIFNNKDTIINNKINEIDDLIFNIENEIEEVNSSFIKDSIELQEAYFAKIKSKINLSYLILDGEEFSFKEIINEDIFSKLKNVNKIEYRESLYSDKYDLDLNDILTAFNEKENFFDRISNIAKKQDDTLEQLKKNIQELKEEKREIKLLSLKDIIRKYNSNSVFNEEAKKEKLIVFLISNGYIDELYEFYTTYFYPGSLSTNDMNYILKVKNLEDVDQSYKLDNVYNIIDKLNKNDFNCSAVINYDLVEGILDKYNEGNNKEYFDKIINVLSNESSKSIEFIDEFKDITKHNDIFIKLLSAKWHRLWSYVAFESNYTRENINKYLELILMYVPVEEIIIMNGDSSITKYVSSLKDINFLSGATDTLKKLGVKFNKVENEIEDENLLDYVYTNNLYALSENMINLIAKEKSPEILDNLETANYTTILNSGLSELSSYVNSNINEYVENIFLKLPNNNNESEEALSTLLNKDEISLENKEKILMKQEIMIQDISKVSDNIWDICFEASKVEPKWDNIINYLSRFNNFGKSVINFLNKKENYIRLAFNKINVCHLVDDNNVFKYSKALVLCNELYDDSYEAIINSIPITFNELEEIKEIPEKRVEILINNDILGFSEVNYSIVKQYFKNLKTLLIKRHVDKFLKKSENYEKLIIILPK